MKFLLLILITLVPGALLSETSEQYTYRAEFFFGDLNEGRDYEDVKAQNMEYLGFLKENDLKRNYSLKNQVIHELKALKDLKDIGKLRIELNVLQNKWEEIVKID